MPGETNKDFELYVRFHYGETFEVLKRVYSRNERNAGLMDTMRNIFKPNV